MTLSSHVTPATATPLSKRAKYVLDKNVPLMYVNVTSVYTNHCDLFFLQRLFRFRSPSCTVRAAVHVFSSLLLLQCVWRGFSRKRTPKRDTSSRCSGLDAISFFKLSSICSFLHNVNHPKSSFHFHICLRSITYKLV